MSNYSKTTDFEAKDSLPTGDSGKIIRGAEFETEFDAISTAIATKADTAGPTFTGTLTFETISDGTIGVTAFVDEDNMASNSATLVPTQQSVKAYVDSQVGANNELSEILANGNTTGGTNIVFGDSASVSDDRLVFGAGSDLQIYHSGVHSYIDDAGTGNLTLRGNASVRVEKYEGEILADFAADGAVSLYHDNSVKIATTSTGVNVTGNVAVSGTVDGRDVATDGTKLDGIEAGATADQTAAEIRTLVEAATDSNVFTDADHSKLDGIEAGATGDQTNAEIRAAVEAATDSNVFTDADHSKLDGIEALADVTDTTNVTAAGALMDSELTNITAVKALDQGVATTDTPTFAGLATTADVTFGDNDKAVFGASSDLQIYHNGIHSFLSDQGTGNMLVLADNFEVNNSANNENKIVATTNGAVTLFYDNAAKIATTSTGIDVTGTVTADGISSSGDITITESTPSISFVDSDGTNQIGKLRQVGDTVILSARNNTAYGNFKFTGEDGSTEKTRLQINGATGDISFYEDTGTTAKLFWDASAESLGVGTTSPSSSYAVDATAGYRSSAAIPNFTLVETDASGQTWQLNSTGAKLSFRDVSRAADRVVIDTAGNVGIGTSSPANKLQIGSMGSSGFGGLDFAIGDGTRVFATFINSTSDAIEFYTNKKFAFLASGGTGNVGIGTSNPDNKFVVSDAGGAGLEFIPQTSNDRTTLLSYDRNASAYQTIDLDGLDVHFNTSGTERMRIDSSGNLLVGTTDTDTQNNNAGSTADNGFVYNIGSGGYLNVARYGGTVAYFNRTSTDGAIVDFRKDGTTVGSIGSYLGAYTYIGSTGGTATHIGFVNGTVRPATATGATLDATLDLGNSSARWKDLYLSGNAYIGNAVTAGTDGSTSLVLEGVQHIFRKGSAGSYAEYARFDTSGNLLVGKTSAAIAGAGTAILSSGTHNVTVDGDTTLQLNRLTSDGAIATFFKDGTSVGSIGVDYGDNLFISGNSTHVGLMFDSTHIWPYKNGNFVDATVDLGVSSGRFKDLYLSGGVYLGGTGSANKLDDYEEGTWTPSWQASTTTVTVNHASYVKIGKMVTVNFYITNISPATSGDVQYITGLPFTNGSGTHYPAGVIAYSDTADVSNLGVIGLGGDSRIYFHYLDGTSGAALTRNNWNSIKSSGLTLIISMTYEAA